MPACPIYLPAEDSYLLAEEAKKYISNPKSKSRDTRILDMGAGSGVQALAAISAGVSRKNVLCADINPKALKKLRRQKLNAVLSDLFSRISTKSKFNLIIFNPPYLPESRYDKQPDTTAGKRGCELITKFLAQAKSHLVNEGVILLLFSSLSKPRIILAKAKQLGYCPQKLAEQPAGMFEKLFVYKFRRQPNFGNN